MKQRIVKQRQGRSIVAVVVPPSADDPHWIVESSSLHYHAQGDTRAEALRLFERGLAAAIEFAQENGVIIDEQPEMIEYAIR